MSYQNILIFLGILGVIISVLGIITIGLILYYLKLRAGNEKVNFFSKIPEKFQQQLEGLIEEELKKNVIEINKKIQELAVEIIESYKMALIQVPRETEKEFLQLRKTNTEIQERLLKQAENKIVDLDQNIKNEISKLSSSCIKIQDILLQEAKNKTDEIGAGLAGKIDLISQSIEKTINERVIRAEKNIEDYKQEKLKEIDKKIYRIIEDVAEKTLGEAISLSAHEKLVIDSLEKAKKEKIF